MADIIITLPTGTEITFDEKWKWFPLYEDVEELMTIDNSDCYIYVKSMVEISLRCYNPNAEQGSQEPLLGLSHIISLFH